MNGPDASCSSSPRWPWPAIVAGLFVLGSPQDDRRRRLDQARSQPWRCGRRSRRTIIAKACSGLARGTGEALPTSRVSAWLVRPGHAVRLRGRRFHALRLCAEFELRHAARRDATACWRAVQAGRASPAGESESRGRTRRDGSPRSRSSRARPIPRGRSRTSKPRGVPPRRAARSRGRAGARRVRAHGRGRARAVPARLHPESPPATRRPDHHRPHARHGAPAGYPLSTLLAAAWGALRLPVGTPGASTCSRLSPPRWPLSLSPQQSSARAACAVAARARRRDRRPRAGRPRRRSGSTRWWPRCSRSTRCSAGVRARSIRRILRRRDAGASAIAPLAVLAGLGLLVGRVARLAVSCCRWVSPRWSWRDPRDGDGSCSRAPSRCGLPSVPAVGGGARAAGACDGAMRTAERFRTRAQRAATTGPPIAVARVRPGRRSQPRRAVRRVVAARLHPVGVALAALGLVLLLRDPRRRALRCALCGSALQVAFFTPRGLPDDARGVPGRGRAGSCRRGRRAPARGRRGGYVARLGRPTGRADSRCSRWLPPRGRWPRRARAEPARHRFVAALADRASPSAPNSAGAAHTADALAVRQLVEGARPTSSCRTRR